VLEYENDFKVLVLVIEKRNEMNNQERLKTIWSDFQGKFENNSLKEIFNHRYVHSKVDTTKKILFTGINPSYNDKPHDPEPYDVHEAAVKGYKRYYGKFQDIANHCGFNNDWTYLDLFYFRATNQRDLNLFLKDEIGLQFLCEQLLLTQEVLEEIKPKLILVFNKRSHDFWGKNATSLSNIWMGYDFKPVQINGFENNGDLKVINGLVDSEGRISKNNITKTNLEGTLVYFLNFFQYAKAEYKEEIKENINKIIQSNEFINGL
jgi:hypothetical protein